MLQEAVVEVGNARTGSFKKYITLPSVRTCAHIQLYIYDICIYVYIYRRKTVMIHERIYYGLHTCMQSMCIRM